MRRPKAGAAGGHGRSPSSGRRRASRSTAPRRTRCRPVRCHLASFLPASRRRANIPKVRRQVSRANRRARKARPAAQQPSACSWSAGWWRRPRAATRAATCCLASRTTCASWSATTRPHSSSSTARTAGTSSCSPRRCVARRDASNSPARSTPRGSGSPTSRRSAARSWVRATARSRTTSSASLPATAAARSTSRRCAGARPATHSPPCGARRRPRPRAATPTSSATCPSPPIGRFACGCATATTSP